MITQDQDLIKSILFDPEVSSLFDDEDPVYIEHKDVYYLYNDGCLFPSIKMGNILSIHAAIPKSLRGKLAVKAGREVVDWAVNNMGVDDVIASVYKDKKHINLYTKLVGMIYTHSDHEFNYYRAARWADLQRNS